MHYSYDEWLAFQNPDHIDEITAEAAWNAAIEACKSFIKPKWTGEQPPGSERDNPFDLHAVDIAKSLDELKI